MLAEIWKYNVSGSGTMPETCCYWHFLCMFASSRLIALCTPNCKSLWIKASAKWLNVKCKCNVVLQGIPFCISILLNLNIKCSLWKKVKKYPNVKENYPSSLVQQVQAVNLPLFLVPHCWVHWPGCAFWGLPNVLSCFCSTATYRTTQESTSEWSSSSKH